MTKLQQWLNRPYPFDGTWAGHLRYAGYAALFVTLFLAIFRPFGINIQPQDFWMNMVVFAGFGIITAGALLVAGGVSMLLPSFYNERDWTVGREILSTMATIVLIATANMLFGVLLWGEVLSLGVFFKWIYYTTLVGLGPTFITIFLKQNKLNRRHATGAEQLNARLTHHPHPTVARLTLIGDNQGEELPLSPADLLYLEAADNYVRVFYENSHGLENTLLRSTLKKMESQLSEHQQFFRCHRTYLVNLDRVKHVSGNAQGYKLHLNGTDSLVPVSRSLNEEIDQRLS